MKIQILYTKDCPWYEKTKKIVKESVDELGIAAKLEEILIDTDEKARRYKFLGSPTVRVNASDLLEKITTGQCPSCSQPPKRSAAPTEFVAQRCRLYFYRGKQYPYPPKAMLKRAIGRLVGSC